MDETNQGLEDRSSRPVSRQPSGKGDVHQATNPRLLAGITAIRSIAKRPDFLAFFDQSIVSIANFLTGAVIGRACTKDEFGLYMLGLTIVFVVLGPQTSLISQPYMVFSPRLDGASRARLTGSVVVHQFAVTLIVSAALVIAGQVLTATGREHEIGAIVSALGLVVIFILFKDFARNVCFANMQFKSAVFLDSVASVVQIAILVLLAHFGILSARLSFISIGIACALGALVWVVGYRNSISISSKRLIVDFKKHWTFGKWLFFSILLWNIASHMYPWILTLFHGTDSTGSFAACIGVIALAHPLANAVGNFVGPKISHSYARDGLPCLRKTVVKLTSQIAALMAPFCLIFLVAGGWIAVMIYGEKYSGFSREISILGLNLLVVAVSIPTSRALQALERADLDFWVNLVPLLVMVFVGVPLVESYRITGAALGLLAGSAATACARWLVLWRVAAPHARSHRE